ncbi:MAG: SH3 domain-containing protein [Anaerolineae bacterium]
MSLRTRLALLAAVVLLPLVTGCQALTDFGRAEARESLALLREITGVEAQAAPPAPAAPLTPSGAPSSGRQPAPAPRNQRAPAAQDEPTPTPAPTAAPEASSDSRATVLADVLNVRAGPGLNFNVVEQVQQGENLNLLQNLGAWLQVRTPSGAVGYVMATYVDAGGASAQVLPVTPRGAWGQQWQTPPGWNTPPDWGNNNSPFPRRGNRFSPAPATTGPAITDNAGNSVRIADQTGGTYTFNAQELMRLLRDEGVTNQDVLVMLMDGGYGNRSETTFGRMLVDCNPINVPVDPSRPNPPGNGKAGAAFCNAVAMHEVYHLVTLVRERWGGDEADADAFAVQRLKQYALVTGP